MTTKKTTKKTAAKKLQVIAGKTSARPRRPPKKTTAKKKRRTQKEILAELATLPIEERIKRARRHRFQVDEYGTLDQSLLFDPRSRILQNFHSWDWRWIPYHVSAAMEKASNAKNSVKLAPVPIPMHLFLKKLSVVNPQAAEAQIQRLHTYVDQELAAVVRDWFFNTYMVHLKDIVENDKPFEYGMLDAVLQTMTAPEVAKRDRYDDSPIDGTKLPYLHLTSEDDDGASKVVKFINAREVHSLWSSYTQLNVQVYRWVNGALRVVQRSEKIYPWLGKRTLSRAGIRRLPTDEEVSSLAEKGKKALRLNETPSFVHNATTMQVKGWVSWRTIPARGRIMIDQQGMTLVQPESSRHYNSYAETVDEESEVSTVGFTNKDFAMIDTTVYGFSFVTKLWGRFDIDQITEINFREDAFEKLVIDKKDKDLILALVKHVDPSKVTDFVDGKGGGCAFLFHGKPGLGKTLTAEAVAETVKRPLYAASVGELGTNVDTLEKNLKRVLQLASRWNAVLLLDEADIFLETRSEGDIHRNAMVGTFLRLLEYYNGILILTSNRVKSIDPAFYSRISFARKYKEHTHDVRDQITRNLLEVNGVTHFTDEEVAMLADHDVNGRQLKNSIRLARFLAEAENRKLTPADVSDILSRVQVFAKELVGTLED